MQVAYFITTVSCVAFMIWVALQIGRDPNPQKNDDYLDSTRNDVDEKGNKIYKDNF